MAFPDAVTQALTGTAPDTGGNMNPEAAMPNQAPPATPTPVPVTGASPTPPAPSPTPANANANQPAAPAQPEAPGEHFRNLSHALKGALLGVVAAGPKEVVSHYQVDDSGKMTPVMRPTHAADRLRLLAQSALQGLAAGSRIPSGPNRGAQWAKGIGAGFGAQQEQATQADLLKRQQAQQNFETTEKAKTENAIRAMHRATTYSLWLKNMQEQNDHDPERAKNLDILNAAKDYAARNPGVKMDTDIVSPEQANAIHQQEATALKNDKTHSIKMSAMFPIGMAQAKDENGQPLFEADGVTPKMVGQVAVIRNGEMMPLPQSFIDDLKEYGSAAGISGTDRINAGQEVPILQLLNMDAKLNQVKQKETDPKNTSYAKQKDGSWVKVSAITGKTTPVSEDQVPQASKATQAEISLRESEAFKNRAEGEKAQQELQNLKNVGVNVPPNYTPDPNAMHLSTRDLQSDLQSKGIKLPSNFATLYGIAHYNGNLSDIPANPRKGTTDLSRANADTFIRTFINPNFDRNNYDAVKKMEVEFASTKPSTAGGNLIAFNTATRHLGALYDAAQALQNNDLQILNRIATGYGVQTGKSAPVVFDSIKGALVGEIGKTFKSAAPDIPEREEIAATLNRNQSPKQLGDNAKTYAHLMLSKASEIGSHYYGYKGQWPVQMISDEARKVYQRMGIPVDSYENTSGQYFNTPGSQPQPATAPPLNLLKEGVHTKFANGQVWTLQNGQPAQVQ